VATPVVARTPTCRAVPSGLPGDTAVINITNTEVSAPGYGALRSSDAPPVPLRPTADQFSSVNFAPGVTDPNLAFVTIGSDGRICYDSDGGTTNVILDLAATIPAASIDSIEPDRLVDTRRSSAVRARQPLCLALPGGTVGDTAVINITNTEVSAPGYGALRSSDAPLVPLRPTADQFSSVNFAPGAVNPNLAFVTIGSDGRICYDSDGGTTNVILDLAATIPAAVIDNIEPDRLVDTRRAAPVRARQPLCVSIPSGSSGDTAVINITNTDVSGVGYGSLRSSNARAVPSRAVEEQFSSVNFAPRETNPNLAFVTIGSDGRICYDSDGGTTNVILDLAATIPAAVIDAIEPQRFLDTRPTVPAALANAESITREFIAAANAGDRPTIERLMTPEAFRSDNLEILLLNTPHRFEECFAVGRFINCNFARAALDFSVSFVGGTDLIARVDFAAATGL
jgi:hypothetical protein